MSVSGLPISRYLAVSIITTLLLASCQSVAPLQQRVVNAGPRVAVVLGGGSAKGFAHIGVIRVLEQEKIPVHMIVGTSVGSLIGGIYAANPDSFQLEWTAFRIDRNEIIDLSIVNSKWGPVQGAKLEAFVEKTVKVKRIEETKIPFYPVATDINTGETVTLEKGSIARAVRASSAIPGIFVPVTFGKRMLVDGGVTNNVPCDIARNKGANIVIAVNIIRDVKNDDIASVIDVIGQSVSIMMHENSRLKLKHADIVIEPDTKGVSMFDFSRKKELMEAGIKAAKKAVPEIRRLLSQYKTH